MPETDAATLLDLSDPDVVADPYPSFARLRAEAPVAWHSGLGLWLATSHAACSQVLRDRGLGRIYRAREPHDLWETFNWLHADSILDSEPPKHTRLRRLVQSAFSRGHVARLAPRIAELTAGLLDGCEAELAETGSFDAIAHLAEPLPVLVIAELLGWPEADRALLRPWSQAIVKMYEVNRTPEHESEALAASAEFAAYVNNLAKQRVSAPGDDLLSDLVAVREGGDRLSSQELVATVVLLLNAGHEASVNGFGNGLASIIASGEHPQHPVSLVEEMLRHDSPLQLFERTATRDVTVGEVTISAGEKVAALLGAANRDPAVFESPDTFRPDRDPNPQLAFGAGIHFCIGAPLARLELETSVAALLHRYEALEVVEAMRRPTFVLRGFQRLLVAPV
ncbi:MAG: cytochrome P450 [Actinomycetota bacterium]|nr:cytochrome P450 [Actinomycetota bacterium]